MDEASKMGLGRKRNDFVSLGAMSRKRLNPLPSVSTMLENI